MAFQRLRQAHLTGALPCQKSFPPELALWPSATNKGADAYKISWTYYQSNDQAVNLGSIFGCEATGGCCAKCVIVSPDAQQQPTLFSYDCLANLFVNARISPSEGANTVLVKCHPGITDNWFEFFLNDPVGLTRALLETENTKL
jgi:hypothetical protein